MAAAAHSLVRRCRCDAPVLRVAAAWGTTIVGVRLLPSGQDCVLGDAPGALAPMPDGLAAPPDAAARGRRAAGSSTRGAPSAASLMLRGREENLVALARAGAPVPVLPGDYGLVQYGLFSIFFQYTTAAQPIADAHQRSSRSSALSLFSSVVLHLGIIGLLIVNWTPPDVTRSRPSS